MNTIQYRIANINDIPQIAKVHLKGKQAAYQDYMPQKYLDKILMKSDKELWKKALKHEASQILVAEKNDTIIGFICFKSLDVTSNFIKTGEVQALYVKPDHLGCGIGSKLLQNILEICISLKYSTVFLWMLVNNEPAKQFYTKHGFKITSKQKENKKILPGVTFQEIQLMRTL